MIELIKVYEQIKHFNYSVNENKSEELLFTFNVDPEENLRRLTKIPTLRCIDKGIKFFKIGLYLSLFEDMHAYLFFREAKKYFDKVDSYESEEFLSFINNEDIKTDHYLMGVSHSEENEEFEIIKKERDLETILNAFNSIRQQVLHNNYTGLKSILRIYKLIERETISKFKRNLKKYKIAFNIIENSKRKEIIELKDSLKSNKRTQMNKKVRQFMRQNNMNFFDRRDKINTKLIANKKEEIEKNYQSVMNVVESHKRAQEKINRMEKMRLIRTIEKYNCELIAIDELSKQYDLIEEIEKNNYERELEAYLQELEKKYDEKHETLRDENKALLNFRRIFFENIRSNQVATLFSKDLVRIFSTKGDNYIASLLWNSFIKIKICEQDFKDFEAIRNAFESMRKKLIRIDNKSKRIFENPDEIFIEIENIENNVHA